MVEFDDFVCIGSGVIRHVLALVPYRRLVYCLINEA